jgi:hypothetical protein
MVHRFKVLGSGFNEFGIGNAEFGNEKLNDRIP